MARKPKINVMLKNRATGKVNYTKKNKTKLKVHLKIIAKCID